MTSLLSSRIEPVPPGQASWACPLYQRTSLGGSTSTFVLALVVHKAACPGLFSLGMDSRSTPGRSFAKCPSRVLTQLHCTSLCEPCSHPAMAMW
ncbi:hypothetical protein BCR44DRAFT_1422444 [Catenaria anguillulae PL171]|uniref:Uncharacterized protein n=1 Tax=Catenaria anguillulae PL171 TaxID=765915 RepID=A0A1Y2HZ17_9FUNG|nr:hypothetical protein BCR44DRAFT_1433675 [Catenaria anguillulae PL171]ORZ39838.1 hypothetical protein BCR44DRAFT_1425732 [Catenaria anguillulae PL171]ORZ41248.1 hypothetical protein BCR44DRAFT_1422444 [Catenaria anguillulae PL171]